MTNIVPHYFTQRKYYRSLAAPSSMRKSFVASLWLWWVMAIVVLPASSSPQLSIRQVLHNLADSGRNTTSATACHDSILETIQAAARGQLWALAMLDATGKMPAGTLLGTAEVFGEYDECLSVSHPAGKFIGQYCFISSNFTGTEHLLNFADESGVGASMSQNGVCIPSSCAGADVVEYINNLSDEGNNTLSNFVHFGLVHPDACITRDRKPNYRTIDYVCIAVFLAILISTILSTTYDCYQRFSLLNDSPDILLSSFSLYTNGQTLLKLDDAGQFGCLHGIKALSMFGIIYGHTAMVFLLGLIVNRIDMMKNVTGTKFVSFNNAHNITDTFFVMGAMLLVVGFFKEIKSKGGYDWPLACVKRYFRLTPTYAVLLLYTVSLMEYVAVGPNTVFVQYPARESCRKNWLWCMLYVQNYMVGLSKCLGHSWYLEVDMQLLWISPLFLYPVLWWPRFAAVLAIVFALLISGLEFYLAILYDFGPVVTYARSLSHLKYDHYFTHTRSAPWFLGIFTGFIFVKILSKGKDFKLSKRTTVVCWSIGGSLFVICQIPLFFFGFDYEQPAAAFCLAYRRLAWAASVAWIIIACTTGHGGIVNKILCWGPFTFLSKISYNIYLIHLPIMNAFFAYQRTIMYGSLHTVIRGFVLFSVLSIFAGLAMTLLVELPCSRIVYVALKKVSIFPYPRRKKTPSEEETQVVADNANRG